MNMVLLKDGLFIQNTPSDKYVYQLLRGNRK